MPESSGQKVFFNHYVTLHEYINAPISFISNTFPANPSSVPETRSIGQLRTRLTFRKEPTRIPSFVYLLIRL